MHSRQSKFKSSSIVPADLANRYSELVPLCAPACTLSRRSALTRNSLFRFSPRRGIKRNTILDCRQTRGPNRLAPVLSGLPNFPNQPWPLPRSSHPQGLHLLAVSITETVDESSHADFWRVTGDALDFALEALGIEAAGLRGKLMDAYWRLDAFPEVPDVLERLKRKRTKTAILSNGSPEMLRSAVSRAGLTGLLDEVPSVEEVGVYKPHPKVYQLAVDRMRMPGESISFISSNAWDAWAASAFGMRVVWCNRYAAWRAPPGSS